MRGSGELEVGGRVAWMGRAALKSAAGFYGAAVELQGEHQVGELRLAVGKPVVVPALALEIVEMDLPHAVHLA